MPTKHEVFDDNKRKLYVKFTDHRYNSVKKCIGTAVYVREIYIVHETGAIILKLEYIYLKKIKYILIPRADLSKSKLLAYAEKGFPINDSNAYFLIEFINNQEIGDPPIIIHDGIGFDTRKLKNGKTKDIFKGFQALGMKSSYNGKLPIKPKGNLKDFERFVKEHINGTPLTLALPIGLSAALVGFLGKTLQCENLVFHFSGDSSTGKTSAARLCVSVGSKPSFHAEHSLLNDYDGTENALLATLIGNQGFPACFDEANMNEGKDFSRFIYRLASGRGKRRLTKEGKQKDIDTYMTTVISTGEKNLSKDSNQNTGKEIRVLTFANIPWTTSAAHAETVNAFVLKNYGWGLLYLARYMLKLGKDEVLERYEQNRKIFQEKSIVKDSFTSRLSGKYSFIMTAAQLANECMDLELPLHDILKMLILNEAETQDNRDIAKKAYDYLLEQANVNTDRFTADTGVDEL